LLVNQAEYWSGRKDLNSDPWSRTNNRFAKLLIRLGW
jgi:hypothetical protein